MATQMAKAVGGADIQEFPLQTAGNMRVGPTDGAGANGVFTGVKLLKCWEEGLVNVAFADGTSKDSALYYEGTGNAFPQGATITIVSGVFDVDC